MHTRRTTGSTMSRAIVLGLGLALLGPGAACDRAKSSDDSGDAGGTSATSEASDTAATGSQPGTDGSGGSGSAGGTGEPIDCAQVDPSEVAGICEGMTTEQDCILAPPAALSHCIRCTWSDWVPVTLEGDACVFGEVEASCVLEWLEPGPGCAGSTGIACRPDGPRGEIALYREVSGQAQLQAAVRCAPPSDAQRCFLGAQGQVQDGPPECACICDPNFPG